jgi:hypothetical protein
VPEVSKQRFLECDQTDLGCPVLIAKTFPFSLDANHFISAAVSSHAGALAIVTNAGRDAVDAVARLTKRADADDEVVWFWRLDAGVKLVRGISLMTVTTKPDHREEHEGNR